MQTHMLAPDIFTNASICSKTFFNILVLSVVKMTQIKIMFPRKHFLSRKFLNGWLDNGSEITFAGNQLSQQLSNATGFVVTPGS